MHPLGLFAIYGTVGFVSVVATYPAVRKLPSEWHWLLGLVAVHIYYLLDAILEKYLGPSIGLYTILAFSAGAALASAGFSIKKKKYKNEK